MLKFISLYNKLIFETSNNDPAFTFLEQKYVSNNNVVCKYSQHSINRIIERTFIDNESISISNQIEKIKENIGLGIQHVMNTKSIKQHIIDNEYLSINVSIRISTKKFNNNNIHLVIPTVWKVKSNNKFLVIIKTIYFSKEIPQYKKNHPNDIHVVIDGI